MHASFVSLGQLIKFAYDATGIASRKRAESDGLTDKDIQRIKKQLDRLIDEEGSLMDRCGELIRALAFELTGTIQNIKVNHAIGETMMDLLEVYNAVVRDDGTYLSPKDSMRWFYGAYAIPRLVLSAHKHPLRFNIAAEGLLAPADPDWYLPTIKEESITWPLEKAMDWIYATCQTSRTQFHMPGKVVAQDAPEMQQNLENASNWQNGDTFPSWHNLHWNFSRSIDRLGSADEPYKRVISDKEKESFLYVLFMARLSTYVAQQLRETYGVQVLSDMVAMFIRHRTWLSSDLDAFKTATLAYIEQSGAPESETDNIWWEFSKRYWEWFGDRAHHCTGAMQKLLEESNNYVISEKQIDQLCEYYGDYTVRSTLDAMNYSSFSSIPEGFPEALHNGFDLKKNRATTLAEIDAYEAKITEKGLIDCLGWMVHWNRAAILYRAEQDKEAFIHIEKAFEQAKYSAGKNQYQIVNQYIELAAKNDKWKCFTKGVAWATYLGLPVRWLRDDPPTEENLRGVFAVMKKGRYAGL